jgi:hypothetical protein
MEERTSEAWPPLSESHKPPQAAEVTKFTTKKIILKPFPSNSLFHL